MLHEKAIPPLQKVKKETFLEKFGADFQRQPFTDVFQNRCS